VYIFIFVQAVVLSVIYYLSIIIIIDNYVQKFQILNFGTIIINMNTNVYTTI